MSGHTPWSEIKRRKGLEDETPEQAATRRAAFAAEVALLESAWGEIDAANATLKWEVGSPYLYDELHADLGGQWEQYAFDRRERAKADKRSREWTAVGRTEVHCVREMARCFGDISAGRVPR